MSLIVAVSVITIMWRVFGASVTQEYRELRASRRGRRHVCCPPRWRALGEEWKCLKCEQVWERDRGFWIYHPPKGDQKVLHDG